MKRDHDPLTRIDIPVSRNLRSREIDVKTENQTVSAPKTKIEPESAKQDQASPCRTTCQGSADPDHPPDCECYDKTLQWADESVDEMIARFELPQKRRLVEPEGRMVVGLLDERDSLILQLFLTKCADEYDLFKAQVI